MTTTLLNEKQVAELYNVSVSALRSQRFSGNGIRFVKFGGKVLYRLQDVEEYINNRVYNSTTEYQYKQQNRLL